MHVVHKGVGDVGGSKGGGKLGLPNTFGEPSAGRLAAEVFLKVGGQAGDLFALIFGGNGNQNGLIEAATDELYLAALDELSQAHEILGTIFFDPGEQRPGIMEPEMNFRMLFEALDKWEIRSVVGFFEDVLEIAARLVRVNE